MKLRDASICLQMFLLMLLHIKELTFWSILKYLQICRKKKMYVKWQFKIQNWEVSGFASKVQVWNCNVSKCSHLEISTCLVPQGCAEKSIERGRQHRLLDNQSSETGFLFWFNPIWNMVFQERDHSWEVRWWSGHWLCWRSCHGSNPLLRRNFFARLSNTSFQLDAVWMTR